MPTPLVSAIVPTFNRELLVCRAVDSALSQSHANMEVVVVDDGSTDDTPAIIRRRYASDPRVKFIRVENGGVARARNIGIDNAAGDFVGFLDSDDYWLTWKVELQLRCLELLPEAGMIWSDMDAVNDEGVVMHRRYLRTMYTAFGLLAAEGIPLFKDERTVSAQELGITGLSASFTLYQGNIFTQMIMGSLVHTSTCLLRRERLEKVGGFREDLRISGEDWDFHLRTCGEGLVAFADIVTIGYTIGRSDQLSADSRVVHIAENAIRTLEPILVERRNRINLSPGMIARVLSGKHAWAARLLLEAGRRKEAIAHALKSIYTCPWIPGPYALLVACVLPRPVLSALLGVRRNGRRVYARLRGALERN